MSDENRRPAADDFTLPPTQDATFPLPVGLDAGPLRGVATFFYDPAAGMTLLDVVAAAETRVEGVFVEGNEIAVFDAAGERVGTITVGERVPAETSWHEAFRVHFEKDEDHGN